VKELIFQIKSIVKNFCPPILLIFLKKITIKKKYYGTNKLDKKIEPHINFNNGFFVELGANDGINHSNTYFFEKYRDWTFVAVTFVSRGNLSSEFFSNFVFQILASRQLFHRPKIFLAF